MILTSESCWKVNNSWHIAQWSKKYDFPFLSSQSLKEERRKQPRWRKAYPSALIHILGVAKWILVVKKERIQSTSPRLSQGESHKNPCGENHRLYWLWLLRSAWKAASHLALSQGLQNTSKLENLSPELGDMTFWMFINNAFFLH